MGSGAIQTRSGLRYDTPSNIPSRPMTAAPAPG